MPISEKTYKRVALEDPDGKWELHCGRLQSKPPMTIRHNLAGQRLFLQLHAQLDEAEYFVSYDSGRVRHSAAEFYIPDVIVIPARLVRELLAGDPYDLELYDEPLPLVVEIWSPSTGGYDVREKLPEYQRRGDLEVWFIHPYDRTLTSWQLRPDGSYREASQTGGIVRPLALPGVSIDLDALFEA